MASKHSFALYFSALQDYDVQPNATIVINDHDLWHRVVVVLRLDRESSLELFDAKNVALVRLLSRCNDKRGVIQVICEAVRPIKSPFPELTLCIGLTKKEAFSQIMFSAGQNGVARVIPVLTRRIHKNWWSEKEHRRCVEQIKAGAEQAKTYFIGAVEAPIFYEQLEAVFATVDKAFLSHEGYEMSLIELCTTPPPASLALCVGPEGGFEDSEVERLIAHGAQPIRLSQAILRSQDAVALGVGIIRTSYFMLNC